MVGFHYVKLSNFRKYLKIRILRCLPMRYFTYLNRQNQYTFRQYKFFKSCGLISWMRI